MPPRSATVRPLSPAADAKAERADAACDPGATLDALRAKIAKLERGRTPQLETARGPVAKVGVAAIDSRLPGGGIALDALHEILPDSPQDHAAATGFLLALLVRVLAAGVRPDAPIVWIETAYERAERGRLYGPGLHAAGLDPARFVFVSAPKPDDALRALEDALRAKALAAAVAAAPDPGFTAARRLGLAAAEGAVPAFLLASAARAGATPALSRWRVAAAPSAPNPFDPLAPGAPRWRVGLARARAGGEGLWTLERADEHDPARPPCLRLVAPLADRPARPRPAHACGEDRWFSEDSWAAG